MTSIRQRPVNAVICAACHKALVPQTKQPSGGVVFPFTLLHSSAPHSTRDVCAKYGYVKPEVPPPTPLSRDERRRVRWIASIETRNARHVAEGAAAEAAYVEPTDDHIYWHRSKLQPGEDCIDERCFYCGSPHHWSRDCLTI